MATGGGFGRSIDIGSDVLYDFSCTPCAYNNKHEEAATFCVECREYFCVSCIKDHNKFAIMRAHQILDKAGMSAMGPQQTSMVLTERCQEHHGNTIDTYCPVHQVVGCIALKHVSCRGIAYIPKVAQGFKKTNEYKNIKPAIKTSLQQLQAFKTTIETDLEVLHRERDVSLKEIKDYRKSIEKELDRMEKKITDEVHTKCKIFQSEIEANMKSVEDRMSKLESHLKKMERIKAENESVIFVCVKDGNMKIAESAELLQNLNAVSKRGSLKCKQNSAIDECMTRFEKLGELYDEVDKDSYKTPNKAQAVRALPLKQNKLLSASFTGEYNMKVKTDTQTCYIYGCIFLDDRVLLITDLHNKKLKRLNSSFQVIDYCELSCQPYGLCVTDNKEVAVVLPDTQTVQFVSVGKEMKCSRSFTTKGQCAGLVYSNGNIFVSNNFSKEVHIYNKNGKCLRTITVDISALTIQCISLTYLALSKDHSKLVYSNSNNSIIIVNVKDGQNDCICIDQLSAARGLCVLDNDNILVADSRSNAIFQITGDGQMLGAVVQKKGGITFPQSVCVDKTNSRMRVTSTRNDKIKVFKLMK